MTLVKSQKCLDHFILKDVIGEGGYGCVYHALDTKKNKDVALKIINLKKKDDEEQRIREFFEREIYLHSQLNHKNIARFIESGKSNDGNRYFSMQLLKGSNVGELIPDKGLPLKRSLKYVKSVATALAHLEKQGIVHRDIKPDNMISTTRGVKLIDFGLAFADSFYVYEEPQDAYGTIEYMAPEYISDAEDLTPSCDVYSLGISLYFFLTGDVPFSGEQKKVIKGHMFELPSYIPKYSSKVNDLIRKMLAKKPKRRLTAEQVVEEVESLI